MRKRLFLSLAIVAVFCAFPVAAQDRPFTIITDYTVHPGKEAEFMELIRTVGQPVRDKLLADGTIMAWGVDVPVLRAPGSATHSIWVTASSLENLGKYMAAIGEAISKVDPDRVASIKDIAKAHDFLFRAQMEKSGSAPPPAGTQPFTRIFLIKVLPGKTPDFLAALNKYVIPTYDKLLADGTILNYELGGEYMTSTDAFTHYFLVGMADLAAADKVDAAFTALNMARSPAERQQMTGDFLATVDPSASRSFLLRSVVFRMGGGN